MNFDNDIEIKRFWAEGFAFETAEGAIENSIRRAARDFTARTETRKKDSGDEKLATLLLQDDVENKNLRKILEKYFEDEPVKNQDAFNAWHHETCKWILTIENSIYENVHYGKAQKILNMTFKNLYCSQYGQSRKQYFRYCHIALDRFTLEWIFRNIYPNYKAIKLKRLCKSRTPAWSNFTYETGTNEKGKEIYSYLDMVHIITKYFDNLETGITPFEAEFIIWNNIQLEQAAEDFYAQAYQYLSRPQAREKPADFKKKSLSEKIKTIQKLLQNEQFSQ